MNDIQLTALIAQTNRYPASTTLPDDVAPMDVAFERLVRSLDDEQSSQAEPMHQPTRRRHQRGLRRGMLVAAAAFVAVLLLGVALWLVGPADSEFIGQTTTAAPSTTSLSTPPATTAIPPTTSVVPPEPLVIGGRIAALVSDTGASGAQRVYAGDSTELELIYGLLPTNRLDWAPDGSAIIFSEGEGTLNIANRSALIRLDPVTGETSELLEESWMLDIDSPRFSPDGTLIAFGLNVDDRVEGDPGIESRIQVIDLDGSAVAAVPLLAESLAWSPDGTQLVYVAPPDSGGGLWVADLSGNTVQILDDTYRFGRSLRWGEAGILFDFRTTGEPTRAGVVSPDGTFVELLDPKWTYPTWGPNGHILVVDSSSGDLWARDTDGEFFGPIARASGRISHPVWVP